MSVTRPFVWVCNQCGCIEDKIGYGFPPKWSWYGGKVRDPEVKHLCGNCTDLRVNVLEDQLAMAMVLIAKQRAFIESMIEEDAIGCGCEGCPERMEVEAEIVYRRTDE